MLNTLLHSTNPIERLNGEIKRRTDVVGIFPNYTTLWDTTAAITEPWSTSPVEGEINRVKTLKRQMYGRAGHALLRVRVLAA